MGACIEKVLARLVLLPLVAALTGCAAAAGTAGEMMAAQAGIPQIAAFLPSESAVPAGASTVVDGVWKIDQIGKRIRIDRGRVVAVDGWLHALTLKVQPGMVVSRDFVATGPRTFTAQDLPNLGPAQYGWDGGNRMTVAIQGQFYPVSLTLSRQSGAVAMPPVSDPPTAPPPVSEAPVGEELDDEEVEWLP